MINPFQSGPDISCPCFIRISQWHNLKNRTKFFRAAYPATQGLRYLNLFRQINTIRSPVCM